MSTQEQILALVSAGLHGEDERFRNMVLQIIVAEKNKGHAPFARRLQNALDRVRTLRPTTIEDMSVKGLLFETPIQRGLEDLVLPEEVRKACRDLAAEHAQSARLREAGIEPRNRVLLEGPPGNGKTALAGGLARLVGLPFLVARYDAIISSYLGETLSKLRRVFDYAAKRPCVLFLDEFDTVGSERSAGNEVGEMRRAVTTLLACLDEVPSDSIVVTATNHKEMLDRAVWRRFQLRLELPPPTAVDIVAWIEAFQGRTGIRLGVFKDSFADQFSAASFAELDEFCTSIHRRHLLADGAADSDAITREQLVEWKSRSVA